MYYVYILRREKDGRLYIGYTANLKKRFEQHKNIKNNIRLIYCECYISEEIARQRERKLKHYGSAWRALKKRISA